MKVCSNCSTKNPDIADKCINCGSDLPEAQKKEFIQPDPSLHGDEKIDIKRKNKRKFLILLVLILFGLTIFGISQFNKRPGAGKPMYDSVFSVFNAGKTVISGSLTKDGKTEEINTVIEANKENTQIDMFSLIFDAADEFNDNTYIKYGMTAIPSENMAEIFDSVRLLINPSAMFTVSKFNAAFASVMSDLDSVYYLDKYLSFEEKTDSDGNITGYKFDVQCYKFLKYLLGEFKDSFTDSTVYTELKSNLAAEKTNLQEKSFVIEISVDKGIMTSLNIASDGDFNLLLNFETEGTENESK